MKVLVFGGTGQLGTALCRVFDENAIDNLPIGRNTTLYGLRVSPSDSSSVSNLMELYRPTHVINLVALTDVDLCEESYSTALEINACIAQRIAEATYCKSARFLHISTDQVYSLNRFNSEDNVAPLNLYGHTKLIGERLIQKANNQALILRTNFIGRSYANTKRRSLTDWMNQTLQRNEILSLFSDVVFNPVSTEFLCHLIAKLLLRDESGIYNVGSSGAINKYELGIYIAKAQGFDAGLVRPISVSDLGLKAKRPNCMLMSCQKFSNTFDIPLPTIQETLLSISS